MVRCSDAKFVTFRKRKSSKKVPREVGVASRVGIAPDGEAPSAAPITKVAGAEVEAHANLSEVPRETDAEREPVGSNPRSGGRSCFSENLLGRLPLPKGRKFDITASHHLDNCKEKKRGWN